MSRVRWTCLAQQHVDVLIVGAGMSGIGHRLPPHPQVPGPDLRGARAPARDRRHLGPVPLPRHPLGLGHVHLRLQLPALDRRRRRSPTAPSIRDYVTETAREYGVAAAHPLRPPRACAPTGRAPKRRWRVEASARTPAQTETMTCRLPGRVHRLLRLRRTATRPRVRRAGALHRPVVHPQHWPADLDYAGKRVVVIGSGATAVTLVPALAADAAHVTMLQRSPSYILSLPADDKISERTAQRAARASSSTR